MKKPTLKQRFSYWFDNQMARGTRSLIKLLVIFTLTVGITVALFLFFLRLTNEEQFAAVLWKSMITVLRSSFPGFHDGGPLYLLIVTFAAICGMFVTSVLIGIVSTAIREKINNLRRGNSMGLERGGEILMNPAADEVVAQGDKILVFSEENDTSSLVPMPDLPEVDLMTQPQSAEEGPGRVVILGCNETIDTILHELPEDVTDVLIAGRCDKEALREAVADREGMEISFFDGDYTKNATLLKLAKMADHVVVLSDHGLDEEKADTQSIFLLLNLRDFKTRYKLHYNITVEMRREHNQSLVAADDNTDYVVSSNMSALFLAQLAESPELTGAFRELLSNEGNELYLKSARYLQCAGERTVAQVRQIALAQGYVVLGYMRGDTFQCTFNPPLNQALTLAETDSFIVLGE